MRNLQSIDGFLCAITVRHSGYDVNGGNLLSFTLLPLDEDIKPYQGFLPFTVTVQKHVIVHRKEVKEREVKNPKSIEQLKRWYKNLKTDMRICLVGYELKLQIDFLEDWMGALEYLKVFSPVYRDLQQIQIFLKDARSFKGEQIYKVEANDIQTLVESLNLPKFDRHLPEQTCLFIAEAYRNYLHRL